MRSSSLRWRVLALVAIVANVVFNYVSERLTFGQGSMVEITQRYPSLFTPAGYAFAIWGLIYASFVTYAIVALLPSQRDRAIHDRLAPLLALANVLGSLWIVVFRTGWLGASVVVIAATLVLAIAMYRRVLDAHQRRALPSRWWTVPFALFLGWLSVATIADVSIFFVSRGWHGAPLGETTVAIALLAITGALAIALAKLEADSVAPAVIAWAAIAIWWQQRTVHPTVAFAAAAIAIVAAVSAAMARSVRAS